MTIVLRPYAVSDRAALIRAINEVCGEGRWMSTRRYEPTPAWERALQQERLDDHLLLVVEDNGAVVGWCRVFPEAGSCQREGNLGIGLLAPYRYRGIGRCLVRQALWWSWTAGLFRVVLRTRWDNGPALRVFVRCGFRFLPRTDGVWADMMCSRSQWPTLPASALSLGACSPAAPGALGRERV